MKNGVHDNVTVMSPDELDIKDEDMEKMKTTEVTLDVKIQVYFKHCESCKAIITFAIAEVPVNFSEPQIRGSAIDALHDALVKEQFIKCKVDKSIMLFATDDISRIIIDDVVIIKENNNEQ